MHLALFFYIFSCSPKCKLKMLSIFVFLIKHKDCSMLWTSFLQIDLVRLCLLWFQFWFIWFELLSLVSCFRNSLYPLSPLPSTLYPQAHKPTSIQAHKPTSQQAIGIHEKPTEYQWNQWKSLEKSIEINMEQLESQWKSMNTIKKINGNQWETKRKPMEINGNY